MTKTVYEYKLKDIRGNDLDLSIYKGKKILFVNTASECGYTPQYKALEELYENYKDRLVVIGLPCNDFGNQEPAAENEIQKFCEVNYGVTFPLISKITILGPDMNPLYKFFTRVELNGFADSQVQWNFHKYLVDENGYLMASFSHAVEPLSYEIINELGKVHAV